MSEFLYVANWKAYRSSVDEIEFFMKIVTELNNLAAQHPIIVCPSALSLNTIGDITSAMEEEAQEEGKDLEVNFALGAQDCSEFSLGAYTGHIAAQSLSDIGCAYCIVGHNERRTHNGETNAQIAQKIARLFEQGICPIICVGESAQEYANKTTAAALEKQLAPLMPVLASSDTPFCIAYEPVWAIGSGKTPQPSEIEAALAAIEDALDSLKESRYHLLYGGSVTAANAAQLAKVPGLDGFLIGSASLDFQEFKKIVLSGHQKPS